MDNRPQRPYRTLLSPMHVEILRLAAQSYTDREIATELGVSMNTVRTHMATIRRRLQVHGRHEAVQVALYKGLL